MAAAHSTKTHRPDRYPRTPAMTMLGAGLGCLAHGMFNSARKRPVSYQPWYFVINAVAGGALLYYTARMYDDITETMDKHYSGFSRLPSWLHDQLTPEQLGKSLFAIG
jgi:hypothetical protein